MLYLVFLRFSDHKSQAREHMAAHNAWVERGIKDGTFLMVGSLQPQLGGALIAHNVTRAELDARILEDPFVVHQIVRPEVLEVSPSKVDPRLAFLLQ